MNFNFNFNSLTLIVTFREVFLMSTFSIRALVPAGRGMLTVTSASVCVHTNLSVLPPLPSGAGVLSSSSSTTSSSPSSPSFFSFFSFLGTAVFDTGGVGG